MNRSIIKHIRPYKPHIWNRFCQCVLCGISSQAARDQQPEAEGVGSCPKHYESNFKWPMANASVSRLPSP